jgi:hypothetical protein
MKNEVGLEFTATVASIVVGFGVVVLMFRIQRELYVKEILEWEINWLARADWLVILAVLLAGLFGLGLPLSVITIEGVVTRIAAAGCLAAVILLMGYIFAILAHYRLIPRKARELKTKRTNPEGWEGPIFWITIAVAAGASLFSVYRAIH